MRKAFIVLLMAYSYNHAVAQRIPPSAVDLRASYCVAMLQENTSAIDAFLRGNPTEKASFPRISQVLETNKNHLSRLQNYLVPRLSFLEAAGLLSARNQYSSDKKTVDACYARACGASFEFKGVPECYDYCNKETGGIGDKQDACSKLTWIPF